VVKSLQLYIIGLFLALGIQAFGQQVRVAGSLIHGMSFQPIPAAHIINISKSQGTITTQEGYFSMLLDYGDTLNVTALGFADLELPITTELLEKTKNLRVNLYPVIYELAEINLTPNGPGKFQRDFEKSPIRDEDAPLPGRPSKREVEADPPPPELANVFNLMYEQFGKRPRELREVQALRRADLYTDWIASLITPKVMESYLMLPESYHEAFLMFYIRQAFHPLDKEYQVYLSAKEALPYFFNSIQR
jgi:hypothetical protein